MIAATKPAMEDIQIALLSWFQQHKRDLPWRHTRDPYAILVSEIMLQQTQVDRVLPYWLAWMERWPNVHSLAEAPVADVIRAWKGLGYNRRAVNLQKAAQLVVGLGGEFPQTVIELQKLPGIGPYTAGAIACFAFEQDVPFLDTNMRRVLHRLLVGIDVPAPQISDKQLLEIADHAIPPGSGWIWNQAIMEFGAVHCTARKPQCFTCPLQAHCSAFPQIQTALALNLPNRGKPTIRFEQTNRYFRGRIMDELRSHQGDGVSLGNIAKSIKKDFHESEYPWLLELIQALENDGLLKIRDGLQNSATIPAGIAEPESVYRSEPIEHIKVILP